MKLFILGMLLATTVLAEEVVLAWSDTTTNYVISPTPAGTSSAVVYENYHNTNTGDKTGYGAKWIWIGPGTSWNHGLTVQF